MSVFSAASFRTVGVAGNQNLFALRNDSGATVRVRRITVQLDVPGGTNLTGVMPLVKLSRISGATGGTALAKTPFDSNFESIAGVVALGATAADGGAATAITATPGGEAWQQYAWRRHSAYGQLLSFDNNLLPTLVESYDWTLQPGETLLAAVIGANNTVNNHWFVQAVWEEFALTQQAYRHRNDDGSEALATWKAALNTAIQQGTDRFRLRTLIQNTTGTSGAQGFTGQYTQDGPAVLRASHDVSYGNAFFGGSSTGVAYFAQEVIIGATGFALNTAQMRIGITGSPVDGVYLEWADSHDGIALATTNIVAAVDLPATATEWVAFTFPGTITVNPDRSYFLRVRRSGAPHNDNRYVVGRDEGGGYPGLLW